MAKKLAISTVAIYIAWFILDYLIHGVILKGTYEATAHLWRPMEEMKTGVMVVVGLIAALAFAYVYITMISPKSMANAVKYGLILGVGWGVSVGYGSYAVMPIPYPLALTWFLGTVVEMAVAGGILGLVVKD